MYFKNNFEGRKQLTISVSLSLSLLRSDMISIMQEYGSEVSDQLTMSAPRKSIKKSSVIRQFRRWNPEFFTYFVHVNGKWVPKLGKEGELRRRNEKRTQIKEKNKTIKKTT